MRARLGLGLIIVVGVGSGPGSVLGMVLLVSGVRVSVYYQCRVVPRRDVEQERNLLGADRFPLHSAYGHSYE